MHRAYSRFEVRSVSEDAREISGIATSPTTDRMGDVVESSGAEFSLPIPLLLHHDSKLPIGEVYDARVSPGGINIRARIPKFSEPGIVKDRLDMAWHSIKAGLIRGLSIGFAPIEGATERIKNGGTRYRRWSWYELSCVVVPAHQDATITAIKSLDRRQLRGAVQLIRPIRPGVKLITTGVRR